MASRAARRGDQTTADIRLGESDDGREEDRGDYRDERLIKNGCSIRRCDEGRNNRSEKDNELRGIHTKVQNAPDLKSSKGKR